eukprot:TRINITY_DN4094_c0_g1_i3.p2 TRINITY_DN4094_c0_g1~~TRINITY_DN4094_c0_g1_i3.p2  ORF type:complete len:234 (+),score=59.45 TRINITY_DN4094_c0_g1_i3:318-1019(+)
MNTTTTSWDMQQKGEHIYLNPTTKHENTFICLPHLGGSAQSLVPYFVRIMAYVFLNMKVVILNPPIRPMTINYGRERHSWYDIKTFFFGAGGGEVDWSNAIDFEHVKESTAMIKKVLDEEIKELGGNSQKVFLGGVSQGCSMALHAGLVHDTPLGGIIAMSGYMLPFTRVNKANENTPILITHGDKDFLIPIMMAVHSYEKIDRKRHDVTEHYIEGLGHESMKRPSNLSLIHI